MSYLLQLKIIKNSLLYIFLIKIYIILWVIFNLPQLILTIFDPTPKFIKVIMPPPHVNFHRYFKQLKG